jgi:hypothetical protein
MTPQDTPTPPRLYRYLHSMSGSGSAHLDIILPGDFSRGDIDDLRAWIALIDAQLSRLTPAPQEGERND